MLRAFAVLAAFVLVAEGQAQNQVVRSKRGDTAVVMTQGNGKWGPPHDAIEILRVSGDTKETTFGAAFTIQATADGGVLIVDTKGEEGLIIRQFDKNGKFVRNIGRQGPGPGEYLRMNLSLAVHPNGSIYVRDDDKSVSVFGADGKLAHSIALNFNNGSSTEIMAALDGSVYVRAPFARTAAATFPVRPFFHYELSGKLTDSVDVTQRWLPEGAEGFQIWQLLPDGRVVITRTDKIGFMIAGQPKATRTANSGALEPARESNANLAMAPLLIGEIPAAPVAYIAQEREELQISRNLSLDKCGGMGGPPRPRVVVPETKLPSRSSRVDVDGRIWITKATTAQKIPPKVNASCSTRDRGSFKAEVTYEEPPVYVAFQPDGTYLGEVRFPLRARVSFAGNFAWALVPDADDVQTLVKYRLY